MDTPPILGSRGYWETAALLDTVDIQPGFILVCHSLGIHLVPQPLIRLADMVVIISGFAHFHGKTAADGRFSKRHIQRMRSRLAVEPVQLIRDFHRDCDYLESTIDCEAVSTSLLAADLQILDESRLKQAHCQEWPPTLLIHGQDDRIVLPQRAEELATLPTFSQLRIIEGAGHGIPFTKPRLCLDLILDFYHDFAHSSE